MIMERKGKMEICKQNVFQQSSPSWLINKKNPLFYGYVFFLLVKSLSINFEQYNKVTDLKIAYAWLHEFHLSQKLRWRLMLLC